MSGKKFFRMGKQLYRPPVDDDEDEDEESEDESSDEDEEEDKKTPASTSKASSNANLSDSDDDDDDDEEEDEEEEEEDTRKRRRSSSKGGSKRPKVSSFIDEEAEDDDDEEDDEPYGTHHDPDDVVRKHYTEADIRKEQMDEEAEEMMRQQDRRRAQAGGRYVHERSVEEMAQEIEDRHRLSRTAVDRRSIGSQQRREPSLSSKSASSRPSASSSARRHRASASEDGPGGPEATHAVSQQSLVPSVNDPSLWMISCSTGKEQELVLQIMNKCVAYARQGRPLGICGVIAAQSKGRIYIESFNEPAVVEAITGVRGLLQYTMRLIPIQDMTTVMTVVPKKRPVKKNEWVRMTRGHYKGDLALVVAVRESGLKCIVQCVPRLDLAALGLPPEEARVRRKTVRPPQKFYNEQELAALGYADRRHRQRFPGMDHMCDYFENNYYHDGYMLKEVTVGSMVKPCTAENPPTLEELQQFRKRNKSSNEDGNDDNEGSKMAASLLDELSELQGKTGLVKSASSNGGILTGDKIEVVEGDLIGMKGKVMSMDGTTIKIKPLDTSLDIGGTGEIEFLASQVRKHIAVGAHVKVVDGRYTNETGTVVAVEEVDGEKDFTAVVLTDVTNKEISLRVSQLRESSEQYSGQDKLAGYELYDLVMLSGGGSANEVGIIVRVGREDFTVINNHGISRDVRPEELRGKRNSTSNRAVALDVQGNQMRCGDQVNIAEGPHKGKTATIKKMSRSQLFLYSQTRSEHAGNFVVRSRKCLRAGSRSQQRGAQGGDVSPFSTPQSQSTRGGPGGARGKGGQDSLIGKTVRIQAGQWKGYLGAVCDATATHVQVELHSRLKKVMVVRERVAVVGDKYGAVEDVNQNDMQNGIPASFTTATPMHGGATPMHGGATPMHGGATPMHDSMSDEVWRPGAMDEETTQQESGSNDWGADTSNAFGSPSNDDSGWGSSQGGSTWQPTTEKQEPTDDSNDVAPAAATVAIKREQPSSTMETHAGDGDETAVWFMDRVCVQLKSDDRPAVIKEINPDKTALVVLEDNTTQIVGFNEVSRIQPKEKDMVLVIGGADVGVEGELVCIDGSDAILKDSNEDFKIVDFVHLAKIAGD